MILKNFYTIFNKNVMECKSNITYCFALRLLYNIKYIIIREVFKYIFQDKNAFLKSWIINW